MLISFRSAILVIAALGASSVAPAQVAPLPEPLIGTGSTLVPAMVVPQAIDLLTDELAPGPDPAIDSETPEDESVTEPAATDKPKPTGNLSSLVSQLRSSDPGSRELECLAGAIYFESKSEPLAQSDSTTMPCSRIRAVSLGIWTMYTVSSVDV